jgi:hypothetical protein
MTTMTAMTSTLNSHPHTAHPAASTGTLPDRAANRRAVFVITERVTQDGSRTFWTRVGAAFDNRDGSVTVKLDALPVSGTLQIREDDRDNRRDRVNAATPF